MLDISSAAARLGATGGADGSYIDVDMLQDMLPDHMDADAIVVGHLAPYVIKRSQVERALILRRSPYELERVYDGRGYDDEKSSQNLQSEILDVVAYDAVAAFGEDLTSQIDVTGRSIPAVHDMAVCILKDHVAGDSVDWLLLVQKNGDLQRYFVY